MDRESPIVVIYKRLRKHIGWSDWKKREIYIKSGMDDYRTLYAILHEVLHVEQPDLSEAAVTTISASQATTLYEQGFRRVKEEGEL